jgi:hypothetical protein
VGLDTAATKYTFPVLGPTNRRRSCEDLEVVCSGVLRLAEGEGNSVPSLESRKARLVSQRCNRRRAVEETQGVTCTDLVKEFRFIGVGVRRCGLHRIFRL